MELGPFGISEIVLIGVLVLVLFGPRKLPEIGRQAGKVVTQLRRSSSELRRAFEAEVAAADIDTSSVRDMRQGLHEVARDLQTVAASVTRTTAPAAEPAPQPSEPTPPARDDGR